jgi:hypothetical protein
MTTGRPARNAHPETGTRKEEAMTTLERYEEAELALTRAEWRRGFRIHATVFAIVMTGLTVLNIVLVLTTAANFIWFVFPLVGWGFGLAMHYVHGVRRADEHVRARQSRIERLAEANR